MIRRKMMGGPELQLSRLRAASGPGGVLTEYNPNYEFGGETYTLTDLKEIPRENLRLVKYVSFFVYTYNAILLVDVFPAVTIYFLVIFQFYCNHR